MDQMLIAPRELSYGNRMLNHNAEEFLLKNLKTSYRSPIYLPPNALSRSQEIDAAVHQHFTYRKIIIKQLNRTLQFGWRSLLIAIVFLSLLVSFTPLVIRQTRERGLSIIFRRYQFSCALR
jgi:hypothetical protein